LSHNQGIRRKAEKSEKSKKRRWPKWRTWRKKAEKGEWKLSKLTKNQIHMSDGEKAKKVEKHNEDCRRNGGKKPKNWRQIDLRGFSPRSDVLVLWRPNGRNGGTGEGDCSDSVEDPRAQTHTALKKEPQTQCKPSGDQYDSRETHAGFSRDIFQKRQRNVVLGMPRAM